MHVVDGVVRHAEYLQSKRTYSAYVRCYALVYIARKSRGVGGSAAARVCEMQSEVQYKELQMRHVGHEIDTQSHTLCGSLI